MTATGAVVRIGTALAPLIATPVLVKAIADGSLNFGGGEKDIVLVIPWMIWSIAFAVFALVNWRRHIGLRQSLVRAVAWATGGMMLLALVLMLVGPILIGAQ